MTYCSGVDKTNRMMTSILTIALSVIISIHISSPAPIAANSGVSESNLVSFPGAQYADPVFSWAESRGVTDIEFFNSTAFGPSYENSIFVGDITTGTLFYFEPNADRTGINLENDPLLSDLIADGDDEISSVTFGTGFTGITDIETGPDGNLYILKIYSI